MAGLGRPLFPFAKQCPVHRSTALQGTPGRAITTARVSAQRAVARGRLSARVRQTASMMPVSAARRTWRLSGLF